MRSSRSLSCSSTPLASAASSCSRAPRARLRAMAASAPSVSPAFRRTPTSFESAFTSRRRSSRSPTMARSRASRARAASTSAAATFLRARAAFTPSGSERSRRTSITADDGSPGARQPTGRSRTVPPGGDPAVTVSPALGSPPVPPAPSPPSFSSGSAVDVDGLVMRYGDLTAVAGVSFTAAAGQVTAVLGPNGAGKTSTIEACEGYRRPSAGRLRVLGLDPVSDHRALTRRMGVMLQDGGVYPGIRAAEMVRLVAALYGRPARVAHDLLARVGLEDRARSTWRQLSGGEQRRLALACALAGAPEVAFLDEPTSGVDVGGRQLVRAVVRDLATQGCCVVVSTHELAEAERLADRVVILHRGAVVADGTPEELMRSGGPNDDIRFGAAPGLDLAGLAAATGAPAVETAPGEYRVVAPPTPQRVAAVTGWLAAQNQPLADLRAGRRSLEDVFLSLTGLHAAGAGDDAASSAPADEDGPQRPPRRPGRRRR